MRLELLGSKITQLGETSAAGLAVSIASKPRDPYSREAGPGDYPFAQWAAPAAPSTRRATAAGSAAEVSKGPTPDPLRLGELRLGDSVFCCPEGVALAQPRRQGASSFPEKESAETGVSIRVRLL